MTLQQGIKTYLESRTDITTVVGNRIFPLIAPQDTTYPYIVFQKISTNQQHDLGGSAGFNRARMQFNCWSKTYLEAAEISEKIRLNMDGFGSAFMGDVFVQSCLNLDDDDELEEDSETQELTSYGVRSDYQYWYSVALPTF